MSMGEAVVAVIVGIFLIWLAAAVLWAAYLRAGGWLVNFVLNIPVNIFRLIKKSFKKSIENGGKENG